MKKNTILFKSLVFLVTFLIGITACKKENIPVPSYTDYISVRTVRYTVLVVPAGYAGFKSFPNSTDTAFVSLYMNNKTVTMPTDKNGLATFNNLPAGSAALTIRYANHCTANLIVDLASKADTLVDNNNLRNASTMVVLFPYSGPGTATISGRLFADLNLTTAGLENAPSGLKVNSVIEPGQFQNFVKHTGDGKIISISYERVINTATTTLNGDYSIQVPATGSGLKIILNPDDFVYNQQVTATTTQRKIFKPVADTVLVFSGFNYFTDLKFQ
jgi:hypothetical protein